jgi:hypothetical protein
LAFPVPSSTLPVARRVLEVFRSFRDARCYPVVVPLAFGSPSELLVRADRLSPVFLSWDSSRRPLARCVSCSPPPSTWSVRVHSHPTLPPGFGSELPGSNSRSVLVVSHHLDGFLRVETCGLVASRCQSWGSSRFLLSVAACRRSGRGRSSHSPRRSYPSKNSLDSSCSASPRPLPPRRSAPFEAVDLGALLHRRVCDVTAPLRVTRILSFLGFVPLQGTVRTVTPSTVRVGLGSVSGRTVAIRRWGRGAMRPAYPSVGSSCRLGEPGLSMLSESVRSRSLRGVVRARAGVASRRCPASCRRPSWGSSR